MILDNPPPAVPTPSFVEEVKSTYAKVLAAQQEKFEQNYQSFVSRIMFQVRETAKAGNPETHVYVNDAITNLPTKTQEELVQRAMLDEVFKGLCRSIIPDNGIWGIAIYIPTGTALTPGFR